MQLEYGRPLKGGKLLRVQQFLHSLGLGWDEGVEMTVSLTDSGKILATGSRQGGVLKCIGVAPETRGEGLTATIVTQLVKDALERGQEHLFLFTKPENQIIFGDLGFYPVAEIPEVALMENRREGAAGFVESLTRPDSGGTVGAIVANCNPFTNGHLYLIEQAAADCDWLHLFILSEDRSRFSAGDRMELVRQGTAHLTNVLLHPTSDYMISSATFPDYFLKDKTQAEGINCRLDLTIFAQRFAGPLGITRRFVGTEPTCGVTSAYNRQMQEVLPPYGIQVVEIPRKEQGGRAISASLVRRLLDQGRLSDIQPLVPPSTFRYLEKMGRR